MIGTITRIVPWLIPATIILCWWTEVWAILCLADAQGGIGILFYTVAYATLLIFTTPIALLAGRTCRRAGPKAPASRFAVLAMLACVAVGLGWAAITWKSGSQLAALRSRSLSTEAINRIADQTAWRYRHERDCLMAVLPNTDADLLRELASKPTVAANVAANAYAPIDVLDELSRSPDEWVQKRLAGNSAWIARREQEADEN